MGRKKRASADDTNNSHKSRRTDDESYLVKKYRPEKSYRSIDAFQRYTKTHRMLDATFVRCSTGATPEKPHVFSTRLGGTDLSWGRGRTRDAAIDAAVRAAFYLVQAHGYDDFEMDDDCMTEIPQPTPLTMAAPPPPPPPPPPLPPGPPGGLAPPVGASTGGAYQGAPPPLPPGVTSVPAGHSAHPPHHGLPPPGAAGMQPPLPGGAAFPPPSAGFPPGLPPPPGTSGLPPPGFPPPPGGAPPPPTGAAAPPPPSVIPQAHQPSAEVPAASSLAIAGSVNGGLSVVSTQDGGVATGGVSISIGGGPTLGAAVAPESSKKMGSKLVFQHAIDDATGEEICAEELRARLARYQRLLYRAMAGSLLSSSSASTGLPPSQST